MSDERRLADEVADEIFCEPQPGSGVLEEVAVERCRQDAKWGIQNHTQMIWLGILAEEFGEAAKAINELHFRAPDEDLREGWAGEVRAELVQVAAVAVAMIESLDRNGK